MRNIENLLAVIHRDGGNYTAEHGLEKSFDDAVLKVLSAFDAVDTRPVSSPGDAKREVIKTEDAPQEDIDAVMSSRTSQTQLAVAEAVKCATKLVDVRQEFLARCGEDFENEKVQITIGLRLIKTLITAASDSAKLVEALEAAIRAVSMAKFIYDKHANDSWKDGLSKDLEAVQTALKQHRKGE